MNGHTWTLACRFFAAVNSTRCPFLLERDLSRMHGGGLSWRCWRVAIDMLWSFLIAVPPFLRILFYTVKYR